MFSLPLNILLPAKWFPLYRQHILLYFRWWRSLNYGPNFMEMCPWTFRIKTSQQFIYFVAVGTGTWCGTALAIMWCFKHAGPDPVVRICVAWFIGHPSHHNDVIMGTMASQITSLTIIHSTVYSGTDQRKHQSSAWLALVRRTYRWPVNSPHKGPVTRKMFPFDNVIMSWKVSF